MIERIAKGSGAPDSTVKKLLYFVVSAVDMRYHKKRCSAVTFSVKAVSGESHIIEIKKMFDLKFEVRKHIIKHR